MARLSKIFEYFKADEFIRKGRQGTYHLCPIHSGGTSGTDTRIARMTACIFQAILRVRYL